MATVPTKKHNNRPIDEEKKEQVKLLLAQGKTLTETSELTGVTLSTIATWKSRWKDDPAFVEMRNEEHRELIKRLKRIRDKSMLLLEKKVDIALLNPEKARETMRDVSSVIDSIDKQLNLKEGSPTEIVSGTTEIKFKKFEEYD